MGISPRQIGWSNESNLLWQISKQMDNLTNVTSTSLSTIIADLATKVTNQQGVPSFRADTLANLPVAGQTGRMFVATDTYAFYRDNGLGWDLIGGPGIGTVTGSGTATQVAFWNGTSVISGSNNLFWDNANSRLGIGTSSPAYKLDVLSSTTTIAKFTGATNAYVDFTDGIVNTRLQNSGGLLFGTTTNHDLTLRTNAASRLTITSGGNVGIGTSSPLYLFHAISSSTTIAGFRNSGAANAQIIIGNTVSDLQLRTLASGDALIFSDVSKYLAFGTNGATERMRLDASGNLGIGTSSPAYKLDVNGDLRVSTIANATTDTDRFIVSDGGVIKYRTGSEVLSDIGGAAASSISGTTNYIPKFTSSSAIGNSQIFDNGTSVGIGTTSPQTQLDIANGLMFGTIDAFPSATYDAAAVIAKTGSLGSAPFNNAGSIVYRARVTSTAGRSSHIFYTGSPSTERMRLDESGNLGLGVTPSAWSNFRVIQGVGTSGNSAIAFNNSGGLDLVYNTFYNGTNFIYLTTGNLANRYTVEAGTYKWYTAPSGTAGNAITFTQAMTLFSTGNLAVGGTTDNGYKLNITGDVNVGSSNGYYFGGSSTAVYRSTNDLRFYVNSGDRMAITSTGSVGIGTTSPATTLDVIGAISLESYAFSIGGLRLKSYANTSSRNWVLGNDYNNYGDFAILQSTTQTGSTYTAPFYISSGRNVGIGTTSPTSRLTVKGENTNTLTVSGTTVERVANLIPSNDVGNLIFGFNTTSADSYIQSIFSGGALIFGTRVAPDNFERMRLTSGGLLGIGTATPQSILDITAATPIMTISASTNTVLHGIEWKSGTSLDAFIKQQPNTGEFRISNGRSAGWGGFITFYTDISERMRITSGGELLINTTTDAGDFKLQVSGNAYVSGSVGIGSTSVTGYTLRLGKTMTGSTVVWGIQNGGIVQSDVTNTAIYFNTAAATQATAFTLTNLYHYGAGLSSIGAGSSITNQYGYFADNTLVGATNNYGFYGNIASGTGRWNLYMAGTANNYLAGSLGIGTTSPAQQMEIKGAAGANTTIQITSNNSNDFSSRIFFADNVSQRGYIAYSNFSNFLAFGTNSAEVARFTSAGELLINTTSDAGDYKLQVNGNTLLSGTLQFTVSGSIQPTLQRNGSSGGLIVNTTATASAANLFEIQNNGVTKFNIVASSDAAQFAGSIKTAAPSGGTAKPFKIGAAAVVTPTSPNRTIEIEIDGTTYYLTAKTTND